VGINLPVLNCGEFEANERLVGGLGDVDPDILDIEVSLLIPNVGPVELPLEQIKKQSKLVMILFWER
jgi:hypothetical protein